MEFGLIGEKLSHSYSKVIHEMLGSKPYELMELSPNSLAEFMQMRKFCGVNVTIPFKEAVLPLCDIVDEKARAIGAVNTVINRDGSLAGYNTDYLGFMYLLRHNEIDVCGKSVIVLGSGGTCKTVSAVISDLGGYVTVVSRTPKNGEISYSKAQSSLNTDILINTTPIGMFPNSEQLSFDISNHHRLCAVIDVIYNPRKTKLLASASNNGIKAVGGIEMLVAQAFFAAEIFLGKQLDDDKIKDILKTFNERGLI